VVLLIKHHGWLSEDLRYGCRPILANLVPERQDFTRLLIPSLPTMRRFRRMPATWFFICQ
jgi:hypothetical protein